MTIGLLLSSNKCDHLGVVNAYSLSPKELLLASGGNLGNFAFKYGASLLFEDDFKFFTFMDDPELINQECSVVILPQANLVNPLTNYSQPAAFLEKITQPCWAMGIGAQASLDYEKPKLQKGTIRYLKVLAEKSKDIFCRCEFTADCLQEMGISNVEVAGCPSYLINPSNNLWQKLLIKSRKHSVNKICLTDSKQYNDVENATVVQHLQRLFLDMVFYYGCYYVSQQAAGITQYVLPVKAIDFEEIQRRMHKSMAPQLSEEKFSDIARSRFLAFWRIDSWLATLSRMDFVIGTRIHGNILALQSEVPAMPIAHDSRTIGLCKTLKIPFIDIKQTQEWSSVSQVISQLSTWKEVVENESENLDIHRCQLAGKYLNHLLSMNLKPSRHLLNLASDFSQDIGRESEVNLKSVSNISQYSNATSNNRYPKIFSYVKNYLGNQKIQQPVILSYGCSTGEECLSLHNYIPTAQIIGLDINLNNIKECKAKPSNSNIQYFHSNENNLENNGPYHCIFAMSVLCRWPESGRVEDCSSLWPFSKFEDTIEELDKVLKLGGLLIIYNANFRLMDTKFSDRYQHLPISEQQESGYVHKFGKDNRKLIGYQDNQVVFQKIKSHP